MILFDTLADVAPPQGVTFDEGDHVYTMDGTKVPGVTTVLRPITSAEYDGVPASIMERARLLGSAVHKIIELDLRDDLDVDSLSDPLVPYFHQWREFVAHSGFKPLLSEQLIASRRYRYCTLLDLYGVLNGEATLIEAKRCVAVPRTAGPQTAGQEIALRESYPDLVEATASGAFPGKIYRKALHLTPERWRLVPLDSRSDERTFLSALNVYDFIHRSKK